MLPLNNRLKKVRDFNLIIKHGRWYGGNFIDLKLLDLAGLKPEDCPKKVITDNFKKQLRIAFAVGLKVHKSAVKRNRVRRQMREVVRLLLKVNAIREGFYLLFVAKKNILNKNYAEISEEMKLLLLKSKLLRSPTSFSSKIDDDIV